MTLRDGLLTIADRVCAYGNCPTDFSSSFLDGLFKRLGSRWPPKDGSQSLRDVVKKTGECGDLLIDHKGLPSYHSVNVTVPGNRIKDLYNKASALASGLCLLCVREGESHDSFCAHHELLKQCVNNDPIF